MRILVKTNNMSKEEWLEWRKMGIGGSDASVIAGVNRFRSILQLWADKTGRTTVEKTGAESEYTHFGTILEPIVKQEFTRRTGLKVRNKKAMLQSVEYPFMLADLDGVVNDGGEQCIFEAKTASAYKKEAWEAGVPLEYVYQVQHYMAVTGMKRAYVAALVGGNHFVYHEVFRDEAMIKGIIRMEQEFWEKNVLLGEEPAADGSGATTDFLDAAYGQSNGNTIKLPEEALQLCEKYDSLSDQLEDLKRKKEEVTNQMKSYLKENETGTVGGRRISWKEVTTTAFDRKRLEKEEKDIHDRYSTVRCYRRFSVA